MQQCSFVMELNEIPTPETDQWFERDMHTLSPAKKKMQDLERRLTSVTAQRDAAWATIAAIKKDFVDDESFGKVVDTLFAEPLVEAERKLSIARDTLDYVLANHHEGSGEFETRIEETLELTKP